MYFLLTFNFLLCSTWDGNLAQVKHVVLVLSGKGGVGKSTITTELALALRHAGKKVSRRPLHSSSCEAVFSNQSSPVQWVRFGGMYMHTWTCGMNRIHQVGILDIDLCGPSIPRMLSVGRPDVHQCDSGWVPVYTDVEKNLALMSIGFMLEDPDEAVVWRGPKKTGVYL